MIRSLLRQSPRMLPLAANPLRSATCQSQRRVRNATISSSTPQFTAPPTEHDMDEKHESFYQRGYEQLANGEVEAAISEFMKALQIKPRHLDSHFNLGVAHINLKNWEQAAECFKNVISICDVYTDAYLNLGTVYMLMDPPDTKRALYNLKKAVVSKPQDGELSYNLGVLLESINDFDQASQCYQMAVRNGVSKAKINLRNVGGKLLAQQLKRHQEEKQSKKTE